MTQYYSEAWPLPDGRSLGYVEHGDPQGTPVFCFWGMRSRRFYPVEDSIAINLKARLISVDPPGFGLSDLRPNWTLLEEAEAVRALADRLGLSRWAAIGIHEGGPRAAALAFANPQQVSALSLVGAPTPPDAPIRLGNTHWLKQLSTRLAQYRDRQPPVTHAWIRENPIKAWQRLHHAVPECDRELFRQYGPRYLKPAFMRDALDEVYRQGLAGPERAEVVLAEPWGFDPSAIQPRTFIWQGLLDEATPPEMGRYLAQQIKGSTLHELPNDGHWFYLRDWQKVLAEVVGQ